MFAPFRRRLPRSAVAWFGGAALAAVAAMLALRLHVARLEATRPDVGHPTAVVAAAADLTRGSIIDAESMLIVDVPSTLVPPGSLTSPDEATGRVLAADLAEDVGLEADFTFGGIERRDQRREIFAAAVQQRQPVIRSEVNMSHRSRPELRSLAQVDSPAWRNPPTDFGRQCHHDGRLSVATIGA